MSLSVSDARILRFLIDFFYTCYFIVNGVEQGQIISFFEYFRIV